MSDKPRSLRTWLAIVLVIAITVRASLWLTYPLAQSNDTPTYLHLANSIENHNGFDRYNGTRTPGYPIFLLLAGTETGIYLFQLLLGLLTTMLVFYITWQISHIPWFAGLMALTQTLNLGQLFFEAGILSEALATFLLFFSLACLCFMLKTPSNTDIFGRNNVRKVLFAALLLGLVSAALSLTRPLFAFIPFWGALFLLIFWQNVSLKLRLGTVVLAALPALVALVIWVNFIHTQFNIWGLDSIGGYHLVNHTSSFFELAPAEFAPIRDTFLQYRTQHIARTGTPVNTIWEVIPPLMAQTKLNYYALGRVMGTISTRLISEHPWLYIQNLVLGWWWFWRVGVFWLPDSITNLTLRNLAIGLMTFERIALFGINMLFLGRSLYLLSVPIFTRNWQVIQNRLKMDIFIWFALSAIWVTSILQTLAEHGDNPRFLAPMQTLVVLVIVYSVINSAKNWTKFFSKRN